MTQAAPLLATSPDPGLRRRYLVAADEPAAVVLRDLVQAGMDRDALPQAAALVAGLDEEARVLRELGGRVYNGSASDRLTDGSQRARVLFDGSNTCSIETQPQERFMPTTAKPKVTSRKADPDAAALADAAQTLARGAGLKSSYTVGEARGVLDAFTVTKARAVLTIVRGDEKQRVKVADLKAVIAKERGDDEAVRAASKAMTSLSRDLPGTVYARKIACFLLALSERSA